MAAVCGRTPVSAVTIDFSTWCAAQATALGKRAILLLWDNASPHESQTARRWLRAQSARRAQYGQGVRLIVPFLPVKSPWLNAIEPKWLAGKKRACKPERALSGAEVADRVCATHDCPHHPHLVAPAALAGTARSNSKKAA